MAQRKATNDDDKIRGRASRYRWEPADPAELSAMIAQKIADGTHEAGGGRHLCSQCREFTDGIVYGDVMGGKGVAGTRHLCRACYDASGIEETLPKGAAGGYIRSVRREYHTTLEDVLLLWARREWPDAFAAFSFANNYEWESRVLASIVRRRADQEPGWIVRLAESKLWGQLKRLAKFIGTAGGYPIDGGAFADWVDDVHLLAGI